jgi:CRP-like cAMP-binding protein
MNSQDKAFDQPDDLSGRLIRTYRKSEVVFREGSVGAEMYLIHSGHVSLVVSGAAGEQTLARLGPGDFFGEMALVDNFPRSAMAVADDEPTEVLVLDKPKFIFMVRQQPQFALTVMHTLCQRIRNLDRKLAEGVK